VIIHAPEGALWAGDDILWVPAQPIAPQDIVSPVGAGDAFCAAVLWGIHENWPHEKTLTIAHLAAAACLGGATATDGIPAMSQLLHQDKH
jgi:sugar/nucleoside kinase (ribokinase family)